ncbi:MAG: MBL fold metallo-hydrolase [Flavobacteriales bacterium]|nr:MBL fold metallo-hydrolase [Flavobacteriales bacterium]
MRKLYLLPLFALACTSAAPVDDTMAPEQEAHEMPETKVAIHPIHHSAMALTWNGHTVLVDPHDGAARYAEYPSPELVLITDIHGDHMDPATLHDLDLSKAHIVAPKAVVDQLPEDLKARCIALANGEQSEQLGIGIEAIPMYNMPDPNDARHPKGRGNGYVLIFGNERIYISGDTEDIPEMRALTNIDVAFVCMNLPYTMTEQQAASGVLAFKPKVVYPYHYRGKESLSDVALFKKLVNEGDPKIDVQLVDWYAEKK